MSSKIMILNESFLAYFAAERPVPRVNAQVELKFSGSGKNFVAQVAAKWFFTRVHPQMFGQIVIPVKCLATEFAAERFVPGVQALVVLEVGRGGVALATLVTWKHDYIVMCKQRDDESRSTLHLIFSTAG